MSELTVGRLDDDIVRRLRLRATANNTSVEMEHRTILEQALRPQTVNFWFRADTLRKETQGHAASDCCAAISERRQRPGMG